MKDPKIQQVNIDAVMDARERNVRENNAESYDLKPLIDDLAYRGQLTPITVERINGELFPLRGFRRTAALKFLKDNNDPGTGGRYIDPHTGKPFEKVSVQIYENLTEAERITLMFDHGQTRNLNKVELVHAVWRAYEAGLKDIEVVRISRGLLEIHYPPARVIEDSDQKRLEYYKGVLQTIKNAHKAPVVLREVYEAKLRGLSNWPTKAELRELLKIHEDEMAADKTNTVSRENPGPLFTARFNEVKRMKEEAEETGNKPKSGAMMNRAQVDELRKLTDSQIGKTFIDVILQKIPRERYAALDKLLSELGKTMTEEQKNILAVVIGVGTDVTVTPEATVEVA